MVSDRLQFRVFDLAVVGLCFVLGSFLVGVVWSVFRVGTVSTPWIREAQFFLAVIFLTWWTVRNTFASGSVRSDPRARNGSGLLFGKRDSYVEEVEARNEGEDDTPNARTTGQDVFPVPPLSARLDLYRRLGGDSSMRREDVPGVDAHLLVIGLAFVFLSVGVELLADSLL